MTNCRYAQLEQRALISLKGDEARPFLQGLISNDMDKVGRERAVYAALLTPQGKYLHDFFVAEIEGVIYLDCEAARRADLKKRLILYRLRPRIVCSSASPRPPGFSSSAVAISSAEFKARGSPGEYDR